jgi:uncharacterized membrane protein YeaQ/YmgE (transglycosylase-associated protein family)
MNLAIVILIGLAIGTMVELLLPGHHTSELVLAMLLGSAGALLSRYFGETFGWYGTDESVGFVAAAIGAVALLLVYGALFRRGKRRNIG